MFDIGFTEIMVILVVALVVIGPERLPTVARTLGTLLGRLNRYVSDVKADVQREMRLEEMKKLQTEIEQQAMGIERTVVQEMQATQDALRQPMEKVQASFSEALHESGKAVDDVAAAARLDAPSSPDALASPDNAVSAGTAEPGKPDAATVSTQPKAAA